jgi:TatD DNase family protein
MLIDTHCHVNLMVKNNFESLLTVEEKARAQEYITQAKHAGVTTLLCVGTSLIESTNCVSLAQTYPAVFASVGIHPNDLTEDWRSDFRAIEELARSADKNKIVAVGESGIDKHYPRYNLQRQIDAFKAHLELALTHDLAIVVHSREAPEETLDCLEAFKGAPLRGSMHCFSQDLPFARHVLQLGYTLGIGGTITYPKNTVIREVVQEVGLHALVLETDAPFLPPQHRRGKTNYPAEVLSIAQFIAQLLSCSLEEVANTTTTQAEKVFRFQVNRATEMP